MIVNDGAVGRYVAAMVAFLCAATAAARTGLTGIFGFTASWAGTTVALRTGELAGGMFG